MTFARFFAASAVALALAGAPFSAVAQTTKAYEPQVGQAGKDVVWVPTHQGLVDRMLDMAQVTTADYLIDLGSGDGRTVITAAKRGLRAHGIEYNPDLVTLSQENAKREGVTDRATFVRGDIFETDFSQATVLTLFLLPELNLRLRPTILQMKPGTRVVSNSFDMGDWTPDETVEARGECTSYCRAHKWIVPAQVGGTWRIGDSEVALTQTYQMLSGTLRTGGQTQQIANARMNGPEITFTAGGRTYRGTVDGTRITGTVTGGGADQAFTASKVQS